MIGFTKEKEDITIAIFRLIYLLETNNEHNTEQKETVIYIFTWTNFPL